MTSTAAKVKSVNTTEKLKVNKSSRVGRKPIDLPQGVQVNALDSQVEVKGPKGHLTLTLPSAVTVKVEGQQVQVIADNNQVNANKLAGTIRAILNNHVKGVVEEFTEKLQLHGVGYRVQLSETGQAFVLNLTLGLSHPVQYLLPKTRGVKLVVPAVTEIVIMGIDKQLVGQVAADIQNIKKGIRKPEPYKGKGIQYVNRKFKRKEAKKKK